MRGGLKGYSEGKEILRRKTPPTKGESPGPKIIASQVKKSSSEMGPAVQFAGGSANNSVYSR